MADVIIENITPIIADIGKVAAFISVVGMVINLVIGAFTTGKVKL